MEEGIHKVIVFSKISDKHSFAIRSSRSSGDADKHDQ